MKYCPNPDCAGLKKFHFVSEFNDTATNCADCETLLRNGPAPDHNPPRSAPDPNLRLVPVLQTREEANLLIIESLLASAKIPYLAQGEQIQDLFCYGRSMGGNPIINPVEILVTDSDFEDAQTVLADFLGSGTV